MVRNCLMSDYYFLLLFVTQYRFSPEEKQGHTPACYMPFGMGPRHCVATKFAAMEIRMAMLAIMRTMKFVPAHNTKVQYSTVQYSTVQYSTVQ